MPGSPAVHLCRPSLRSMSNHEGCPIAAWLITAFAGTYGVFWAAYGASGVSLTYYLKGREAEHAHANVTGLTSLFGPDAANVRGSAVAAPPPPDASVAVPVTVDPPPVRATLPPKLLGLSVPTETSRSPNSTAAWSLRDVVGRRSLRPDEKVVEICFLALGEPKQIDRSVTIIRNIRALAQVAVRFHLLVDRPLRMCARTARRDRRAPLCAPLVTSWHDTRARMRGKSHAPREPRGCASRGRRAWQAARPDDECAAVARHSEVEGPPPLSQRNLTPCREAVPASLVDGDRAGANLPVQAAASSGAPLLAAARHRA